MANNTSKTILAQKDINTLANMQAAHIADLITRIKNKPVIEEKKDLKEEIIEKLETLKKLLKTYRKANDEVHRIKNAVKRGEMTSEEHEQAKIGRQKISDEKEALIKDLKIIEKKFDILKQIENLKTKTLKLEKQFDKAEKT